MRGSLLRRMLVTLAVTLGVTLLSPAAPSQAASCPVTFHGYTGHYVCGTDWTYVNFTSQGVERMFVIGTDYAIWNIVYYQSTGYVSGWKSLGGKSYTGVYRYSASSPTNFTISTIGTNNLRYCDRYTGGWSGWYRC